MTTPFSVRQIADDVQHGRRSAESVAREALDRAREYARIQPQAWILRLPEAAVLASAQAIDARLAGGAVLPLAGVPFVVKDNIDVAGLATTAACPEFAYTPDRSSGVVDRLLEAGALLLGKANLDQFATGLSGARSPYGVPHCVFNADYVSGGSSSGSAVLVGAGVAAFSLGTDTAGSGRVPAAINGLVGFKPTRGRWSLRGVVPACRSLDCVTVFTHDVEDAERVDAVVAHHDPEDVYSRRVPAGSGPAGLPRRLGIALAGQLDFSGDLESAALFEAGVQRLADCGVELVPVDIRPLLEAAQLLYGGAFVAERLEVTEELLQRKPAAVHPVVRTILQEGRLISGVDLFRGIHRLQGYQQVAQALWEQVDALCLPTAPTIFRVAAMLADPIMLNSILGRYTNFVNLLDMSGIALPAGFRSDNTGFGLTLIAPAWAEPGLFALGRAYQQRAQFDRPALDTGTPATRITLAVVGAHLRGQPLHWQLESRHAEFVGTAQTAAEYRLYAMAGQQPAKPALVHAGAAGRPIALELYRLSLAEFGSFVAEVPAPLAIGTVTLSDGSKVKGFVAEPRALDGATDISDHGGWLAWLAARATP